MNQFPLSHSLITQDGYSWNISDLKTGIIFLMIDFRKGSDFSLMYENILRFAVSYDFYRAGFFTDVEFMEIFSDMAKKINEDVKISFVKVNNGCSDVRQSD